MGSALKNTYFQRLRINEIKPEGWMLNQLKIQADGLSGNLDKFWPDIKDSSWIGGSADGWERVPYWLDGFIPLAWLLNDEEMKTRATFYIDYIIEHQSPDGWICPQTNTDRSKYDMWALFLILKVLVVYHDATTDPRIEDVIHKALLALDSHIDGHTLFNWAQMRWYECLISIYWLYERKPEDWLINLAFKLQSQGFNWQAFYKYFPYKIPQEKGRWSQMSHVVNTAMMLKSGALLWRVTGSYEYLTSTKEMFNLLDEYHGMVTGVFTGDECLAGISSIQGTELCSIAELMYSLEHLIEITGDSGWADRLELVAYNALPAAFSPDMWCHQYDQQVNQVQCTKQENPVFNTNSGEAHLFGLEPNFGCCTANLSQPWPKFALSTFMKKDNDLVSVTYAPCTVYTDVNNAKVTVTLETNYPFDDTLNFKVITDKAVEFTIWLRIPTWADNAEVKTNEGTYRAENRSFYPVKRNWSGETSFTLHLPMKMQVKARPNNLYAVTRGPLVYSIPIGEKWIRINEAVPGHEAPHCDYEIIPTSHWNYGLYIDRENPKVQFESRSVGSSPFSPSGAPSTIKVLGRQVDWPLENGSAAPTPRMNWVADKVEELRLIPYGCTNLRMTEMPIL